MKKITLNTLKIKDNYYLKLPDVVVDAYHLKSNDNNELIATRTISIGTQNSMQKVSFDQLDLKHNVNYFLKVKVKNNAGLESELWKSDGVKIDLTDPKAPIIRRDQDFVVKKDDTPIKIN